MTLNINIILLLINDCKNKLIIDKNNKVLDLECHKQCSLGQYSGPICNIGIKNLVSDNLYYPDIFIILNILCTSTIIFLRKNV